MPAHESGSGVGKSRYLVGVDLDDVKKIGMVVGEAAMVPILVD